MAPGGPPARVRARTTGVWEVTCVRRASSRVGIQNHYAKPQSRSDHKYRHYDIAFAMTNAAVAASPPTTTVCHALRKGLARVNRALTDPNTTHSTRVTEAP